MSLELAVVAGAYLVGSIPFAYLIVRVLLGADIRRTGSGNVGATNTLRAAGPAAAVSVAVLDVGKGLLPVLVMGMLNPTARWLGAAAAAAVIGHCFPVWLGFRGGKGVATAMGAFVTLGPLGVTGAAVVWLVALAVRRAVSFASVLGAAAFPILLAWLDRAHLHLVIAAVVVALVIIFRHAGNLRRLAAGLEPRLGERRDRADREDDL